MATELGVAYLSLTAETKDFAKAARQALGDIEKESGKTGKSSGSKLGAGIATGMKVAGGAIAGVAALVGGLAIKGGISRALAIEDAQAKLKGLGHDTQSVTTIMDSALASVRGTAFGLGDAAGVAATVVAAGVQPGEDLTRTLKLVADASTIAGTSMGDMGAIFNKVAGTGKIQGEVIAQLGERGIPILALLADELGVTAGEVADLASKGKIDFATFQNAMEAGMGGAALASGDTFRGAMANAMAALGRLGEKVVGGILPQLKGGFGEAIEVLDSWAPQAERVGAVIGEVLSEVMGGVRALVAAFAAGGSDVTSAGFAGAMERIGLAARVTFDFISGTAVPALAALAGWMSKNRGVVVALAAAIGALVLVTQAHAAVLAVAAAGGIVGFIKSLQLVQSVTKVATAVQWAWNAALTANPIGLIIAAVAALVAGIVWFFTQTEVGQKIVQTVWAAIQAAISAVVDWVTGTAVPWFQNAWASISAAVQRAWAFIKAVIAVYVSWVQTAISTFIGGVTAIWNGFWGSGFGQLVKAGFELVAAVVSFGVALVRKLVGDVVSWVSSTWSAGWSTISSVVSAVWSAVSSVVSAGAAAVSAVVSRVMAAVSAVWTAAWSAVSSVVSAVWSVIVALVAAQVGRVRSVIESVSNGVRAVVTTIWSGIQSAIVSPIQQAVDRVRSLIDSIKGIFSGAGSWLVSAGKSIIDGLISGITSKIKAVTDTLKNLTSSIPDWKGPADVDRKLLVGNGQLIMGGLVKGLQSGYGNVRRELQGMTADLPTAVSVNANLEPRGSLATQAPPVYVQNPFTGEYLLGRVDERATGVLAADHRASAGERQTRGRTY